MNDCKDLEVDDGYYCCFIHEKGKLDGEPYEEKICEEWSEDWANNKDEYYNMLKESYEDDEDYTLEDVKAECDTDHSNYLSITFFALFFLLN